MLGILNNSSANSSSSLMTGKMMGSIIDVLMPPLSHVELALGYLAGAATRGVLVAVFTAVVLSILPLSFLSGTFYRIDVLPEIWQKIIQYNPLFYLIDGFRYGFMGVADSNVQIGVILTAAINSILFIICLRVLKSGWRLKA